MDITLTEPQQEFFQSTEKYVAFVSGFGAGKTNTLILKILMDKFAHPTVDLGYFAPTYRLISDIFYPRVEEFLNATGMSYRLNKQDSCFYIAGYGRLLCRTMETPDRIVGFEIGNAYLDEFDTLKTDLALKVWNKVIARIRQPFPDGSINRILVATTPEGFKATYKLFKEKKRKGYRLIKASTHSNPHLSDDYIQAFYQIYSPELIEAYVNGEFVNLTSGTVYADYNRDKNRSLETVQKGEDLRIGMDFNVYNMSAVVYVVRGSIWHAVSELHGIRDTPAMIVAINEIYADHAIRIYPDASGDSHKSVDASKSDIGLLENAGYTIYANKSNPLIKDRVISSNTAFRNQKVMINDLLCPETAKCFEQLTYDKNGVPDKKSNLDHLPDAGTYPIAFEMPIIKPTLKLDVKFVR